MINYQPVNSHTISSSARFLKNVKLPNVDPNCIFTSRSVINNKIADYFNSTHLPSPVISQLNKLSARRNYKSFTENDQIKRSARKHSQYNNKTKVYTQPSQPNKLIKSVMYSPSEKKKQIADKILKITQQLGMNRADYKNYMRTDSLQERKHKNKSISKLLISQSQLNNNSTTIMENKRENNSQLSIQLLKQKLDCVQLQSGQSIININKCNLKLKPMPRGHKFSHSKKISHLISQDNNQLMGSMNKSIRGWTKYGKISEQFQQ